MVKKPKTTDDLAEQLRIVAEAVPGLRDAGVLKLQLGELVLELEPKPLEPAHPRRHKDDPDESFLDPEKFRRRDEDERDPDDDEGDDR